MFRFIWILGLLLCIRNMNGQLAMGAPAPDFAVIDIFGNPYNLYSKMGNKAAVVDFSVSWCMICWQFHVDGTLKRIYDNLSNEATTVFLETDHNTNTNCLYGPSGCIGGFQGDWVTGMPFQIADLSPTNGPNIHLDYKIHYFPTVYVISPDKRAWEIYSLKYEDFYNWLVHSVKLNATPNLTHCNCGNNGRIKLNVSGGYGALNYAWSNGATTRDIDKISGGSYSVTITDQNGYFKTFGPWIVNPPPRQVDVAQAKFTTVKCNGDYTGGIEIQAAYGTPPYTYQWSNGKTTKNIENVKADTYVLTLTDAVGCTNSRYYIIDQPDSLQCKIMTKVDECEQNNGSIQINVQGGIKPYYFDIGSGIQQSHEFTSLKGGKDYIITITDNNFCTLTSKVNLAITKKPEVFAGNDTAFINCHSDVIILDGKGSDRDSNLICKWLNPDGSVHDSGNVETLVNKAGNYILQLFNNSTKCKDWDTVQVFDFRRYPNLIVTGSETLDCRQIETKLQGSSDSSHAKFSWKKISDSSFLHPGNVLLSRDSGRFILQVIDSLTLCAAMDTVQLTKNQAVPFVAAKVDRDVSCSNPQVFIDARGTSQGPEFTYLWTSLDGNIVNGQSTLTPVIDKGGNYHLVVTNESNGCRADTTLLVRQQTVISAAYEEIVNDLHVHFFDKSNGIPTSWYWDFGDPSSMENNSLMENPVHEFSKSGEYEVCMTVENDCHKTKLCKTLQIGNITKLDESKDIQLPIDQLITEFRLVPNPATNLGHLQLKFSKELTYQISIIDLLGKVKWKISSRNSFADIPVDLNSFSSGIYLVKLKSQTGQRIIRWIIQ